MSKDALDKFIGHLQKQINDSIQETYSAIVVKNWKQPSAPHLNNPTNYEITCREPWKRLSIKQ